MKIVLSRSTAIGIFVLSVIFILGPGYLRGQHSIVEGTVCDDQGNTIGDVKIILLDASRGTRFSMQSDKNGKFTKVGIPPSMYRIQIEHEGYLPFRSRIRIRLGVNKGIKISLEKIPIKIEENEDFIQGINFFKAGEYQEAIEFFMKVAEQFPENFEVYYNLGLSHLKNGQVDEAISALEKTKELKPDLVEAHFALGECYFSAGNKEEALLCFSGAIDCQPENARAHFNLGITHYKYDEAEEAVESFEKSIELDPTYASAYYHAGLAKIKTGDFESAMRYLEQFLRLEPDATESDQVKTIIQELKKQTPF